MDLEVVNGSIGKCAAYKNHIHAAINCGLLSDLVDVIVEYLPPSRLGHWLEEDMLLYGRNGCYEAALVNSTHPVILDYWNPFSSRKNWLSWLERCNRSPCVIAALRYCDCDEPLTGPVLRRLWASHPANNDDTIS